MNTVVPSGFESLDCAEVDPASTSVDQCSLSGSVERRTFLVDAAVLASGLVFCDALPAATSASGMTGADMVKLAVFLTGKTDLSADLVSRAHQALVAGEPAFDQRMMILMQRISTAGLSDVEAFRTSSLARDPQLIATAIAVISAFYTGRVGSDYKGHLVSYEQALMYRPTADVTVIPTYSRGAPGYWVEAP